MIRLYDATTGAPIGSITEAQLAFLEEHLEEESAEDQDYWINAEVLDFFEEHGGDAGLITLLRGALAGRDDMEIRWQRA
jgi:hypothetical protein